MQVSRARADAALWLFSAAAIVASFLVRAARRDQVRPDFDDGVYWQTALAVGAGNRPYAEVFHSQPPLFPALISAPFQLLDGSTSAEIMARLLIVAAAVLLAAATGGITNLLSGRRAGVLAALVVAVLPPVQRYCYQFGADLPAAALAAVAVFWALRAQKGNAARCWAAAGVSLGLAISIKLIAVLVVPTLLLIACAAVADAERVRRARTAFVSGAAGFAAACAVVLLAARPPAVAWSQIFAFHLQATGEDQKAPAGALVMLAQWMVPFALLSSAAMIVSIRGSMGVQRSNLVAISVWAAIGMPFAAFYRPISEHHLLFFIAPGAVLTAAGAAVIARRVRAAQQRSWLAPAAVAVVAAACALQAVMIPVSPPIGAAAMRDCLADLPRRTVLVTDDQELLARAGLRTPPWLADTSRVRLGAGYLPEDDITAGADHTDGVLLAPPQRARLRSPTLLAWVQHRFPVLYQADGYRLFVNTAIDSRACQLLR